MTFLQPSILWALPLVLLPVIIHLINRLRHRPQPWGAMMFLLRANRASTSHAKLRQWLILLFRCLAVLALILFVSRPLAGGWIGWAISPAPDVIVILLDRSASMEARTEAAAPSKREQALQQLVQAAGALQDRSHLVLIDSATRLPQRLSSATALTEPSLTGPTDTAADLPSMLATAHTWLVDNQAGTAEIWIASDLQQSNWQPGDDRWQSAVARLSELPQRVRIRLLALGEAGNANASVSLQESLLRTAGASHELELALDVHRTASGSATIPVSLNQNGATTTHDLTLESASMRWRHRLSLGGDRATGWGSVTLPADANLRDNAAYFVFADQQAVRTVIVSAEPDSLVSLRFAAQALGGGQEATLIAPAEAVSMDLAGCALLVWQGALPADEAAVRIRSFAQDGGMVLFLPGETVDDTAFADVRWGEPQAATNDVLFIASRWDEREGPLAKTEEGFSLPVNELGIRQRRLLEGSGTPLATFTDGPALLLRKDAGRGSLHFLATLPAAGWSTLSDGPVLVPMMQRLLQAGARRLSQEQLLVCGELSAADQARQWTPLHGRDTADIRFDAGVYRSGERVVAVNRPPAEDGAEILEAAAAQALFGSLPLQMLEQRGAVGEALQGEIWRLLLGGMLLFLLVEGFLILPEPSTKPRGQSTGSPVLAKGERTA